MGKRPPVYTFQRPRRRKRVKTPPSQENIYSSVDDLLDLQNSGMRETPAERYAKYTFFVTLLIFFLLALALGWAYMRGFPVRIRA